MPTSFLDSRDDAIADKIRQIFREAEEIFCIVAFWGRGARDLFCDVPTKRRKKTRIVCNLTMGGTNPGVIKELMDAGFRVKHSSHLHSKVYWANKGVVVDSANASANGLSLEGIDQRGWLEAAYFSSRQSEIEVVRKYVQEIWRKSDQITTLDLKKAWKSWRDRRPPPPPCPAMTFVDALKRGKFTDRRQCIHISIDVGILSADQTKYIEDQAGELQKKFIELKGRRVEAWVNWPKIPREEYIVDFYLGRRGGLSFGGVWKTLPMRCDRARRGETYQFAYRVKVGEIGMTAVQRKQMTDVIRCIVGNHSNELAKDLPKDGCRIGMDRLLELASDGVAKGCFQ